MAAGKGDARKVVMAALLGNGAIAIAKFVAAFLSGSVAMIAEAVHSVADTTNQGLLLLGMGLSKKKNPERFAFGRAAETYFWSFVVSLMLFFLGGVYAIYEGIHKLTSDDHAVGSPVAPIIVLSLAIVFEGTSFFVAIREFNKERGDTPMLKALFGGRDPVIPVVVLEDAGAVFGLIVALVAVITSWLTGNSMADGIGSLIIGVLMCTIGVALAFETHGLIIGEAATPENRKRAHELATATDGVEAVTQLLSLHLGPRTVVLALKIRFARGASLEEIERVTDALEARIRAELPEMKHIFVEPDGDHDRTRDSVV